MLSRSNLAKAIHHGTSTHLKQNAMNSTPPPSGVIPLSKKLAHACGLLESSIILILTAHLGPNIQKKVPKPRITTRSMVFLHMVYPASASQLKTLTSSSTISSVQTASREHLTTMKTTLAMMTAHQGTLTTSIYVIAKPVPIWPHRVPPVQSAFLTRSNGSQQV